MATMETEKEKGRNNIFLIKIMNQQHATWQGTVTLLGRKATRAAKLRGMSGGVDASLTFSDEADTLSFRSLLELIHMIDGALEDGAGHGRAADREPGAGSEATAPRE
jgi:hypothetical protein